jgi:hypothetical protein
MDVLEILSSAGMCYSYFGFYSALCVCRPRVYSSARNVLAMDFKVEQFSAGVLNPSKLVCLSDDTCHTLINITFQYIDN